MNIYKLFISLGFQALVMPENKTFRERFHIQLNVTPVIVSFCSRWFIGSRRTNHKTEDLPIRIRRHGIKLSIAQSQINT